jgi:dihydrofolate reductase
LVCSPSLTGHPQVPLPNHLIIDAGQREELMSDSNAEHRTITLHMVSSLDGFIAKRDNDIAWMDSTSVYEAGVSISEEEAATFLKSIDCYVLGSRTYEHALELGWPYGDTPAMVVTSRKFPTPKNNVEFYSGDLDTLVDLKLAPRYRNIWLVGGAMLCQRFLELGLVDKILLTIAPVLLGDGLRLFGDSRTEKKWKLQNVVAYRNGFVELSYSVTDVNRRRPFHLPTHQKAR